MTRRRDTSERRFYGRRTGHRLRPHQVGLVDDLLPKLRVDPESDAVADPLGLFPPDTREVWLEIGFGGGEHIYAQAQANPDCGIIGCEPFLNGIAKLLTFIDEAEVDNIRIYPDDARDLIEALPDACIDRAFLLFPDPWPKTRHHKRRFVNAENLDQLARIIKPGGRLRFASDIPDYVHWTLLRVRLHPAFEWLARTPSDWRNRPADWPATRYETKALEAGRTPSYLTFQRV